MKKEWIIAIVIIILILLLGIWYFYSNKSNDKNCANGGQTSLNDATGQSTPCCDGLTQIGGTPLNKYRDGMPADGYGSICSDCGNGICESWEHKYNCPADCK